MVSISASHKQDETVITPIVSETPGSSSTVEAAPDSIQYLVERWRVGSERAASQIYDRFVHEVTRVVRFHLNRRYRIRCDEEDAIQQTFMEMFRRLQKSDLEFESEAAFCRWIRAIARNRTIKLIRFHSAGCRALARENHATEISHFNHMIDTQHAEVETGGCHALGDELEAQLQTLDEEKQLIVRLLAHRFTQDEIAAQLGCTARTVRRRLQSIRRILEDDISPGVEMGASRN